ncbi:MAG TPA: MCE family protein [Oscillatoriales cyanobacterium M59_W2019_021]|nr:MCE family protein [Oscillatoriales cyanobacterium M4454_W2019_049]HIK50862.1 MCE family protein [Oscillatoriales cyanobacterium M59_W2019_021]
MLREGSLGLFILLGLGLVGGLVLWLKGVKLGGRSYQFIARFPEVIGIQVGSSVRYRGVTVGKIAAIDPGVNGVDVTLEINSSEMLIPRHARIEANQGGFIGETAIDIVPPATTAPLDSASLPSPLSPECNDRGIICDGDRLAGDMGVSFAALMRASTQFTETFGDPKFFTQITALTENSTNAVEGIATLANDLSELSQSLKSELNVLSDSALSATDTVGQAADRLSLTAGEIASLATTVNGLVENNQSSLVATLDNVNLTASEMARLATTVNTLVDSNRSSLAVTLENVSQLSTELRAAANNLAPLLETADRTFAQVERSVGSLDRGLTTLERSNLLTNLEEISIHAVTLSANAAEASENLRQVTATASDPTNRILLQETLDSARSTFQNVQKITSDLDDLTGDPEFRENIRRLVNGLSGLVSSTEQLQNQIQTAQTLEPLAESISSLEEKAPVSEPRISEENSIGRLEKNGTENAKSKIKN